MCQLPFHLLYTLSNVNTYASMALHMPIFSHACRIVSVGEKEGEEGGREQKAR